MFFVNNNVYLYPRFDARGVRFCEFGRKITFFFTYMQIFLRISEKNRIFAVKFVYLC